LLETTTQGAAVTIWSKHNNYKSISEKIKCGKYLFCSLHFLIISFGPLVMTAKNDYVVTVQPACISIYDALQSRGFCEIGNRTFLKSDYDELYRNFDVFIELMTDDEDFSMKMYDLEKSFLSIEEYKKRYCSAPPSYRDPKKHKTKRFNKIYFQFIKHHFDFIVSKPHDVLERNQVAIKFLNGMAKELFSELIEQIEVSRPGIKKILYGKHSDLTIVSKIVRYEKSEGWGTTPHCDKSAFSLIWGSDDDNDDSFLLCENTQNPSINDLQKPKRQFSQKSDITSIILIPGSACAKVGLDLKPTVHGVASI
jgi:hypothetical protein